MVIGLTGGVGSGKSRILELLREDYGAFVIQADQVARELEEPGKPGLLALVEAFGSGILDEEGRLDRNAFAVRIFTDPEALKHVNAIIHPLTWNAIQEQIRREGCPLTVVEAALFQEESRQFCDHLVFVDVSRENRILRLMEGRGYSREKCLDIMNNQPDRERFLALCDHVIDNNGSWEDARAQVDRMMEEFTNETR